MSYILSSEQLYPDPDDWHKIILSVLEKLPKDMEVLCRSRFF